MQRKIFCLRIWGLPDSHIWKPKEMRRWRREYIIFFTEVTDIFFKSSHVIISFGKVWKRHSTTLHSCRLVVCIITGDRGTNEWTQVGDGCFSVCKRHHEKEPANGLTSLLFLCFQILKTLVEKRWQGSPAEIRQRMGSWTPPEVAFKGKTCFFTRYFSWWKGTEKWTSDGILSVPSVMGRGEATMRLGQAGRVGIQREDGMISVQREQRPDSSPWSYSLVRGSCRDLNLGKQSTRGIQRVCKS